MTKTDNKVTTITQSQELAPVERVVITPMDMINHAVSNGAQIDVLEKLMTLQERWEANEARKAFNAAIADAKAKIKPILKNRKVDYTPKSGGPVKYDYEDLGEIARTVDPVLAENGLNYRYRSRQEGDKLFVICTISHRDGYSVDTELSASSNNPAISGLQALGSAITYLQRYTLKLALGLSASKDDDGRAATTAEPAGPITEAQVEELIAIADEIGQNRGDFCDWLSKDVGMEIGSFEEIPAGKFARAKYALEAKRRKVKA